MCISLDSVNEMRAAYRFAQRVAGKKDLVVTRNDQR